MAAGRPRRLGIRVLIVCLAIGALVAVYIQGEARGWWNHGSDPAPAASTAGPVPGATSPTPPASGGPPMSGGYEIGPDGILVCPAEHAASTYTLPTLPQTATENTERGAEAAAEHYLALLTYAWNTGNTKPLTDMSDPSSQFANSYIRDINHVYEHGWNYGTSSSIIHVLRVEPVPAGEGNVQPNTIGVKFQIVSNDGVTCRGQRILVKDDEYTSTLSLFMTWKNDRWVETQGRVISEYEQ